LNLNGQPLGEGSRSRTKTSIGAFCSRRSSLRRRVSAMSSSATPPVTSNSPPAACCCIRAAALTGLPSAVKSTTAASTLPTYATPAFTAMPTSSQGPFGVPYPTALRKGAHRRPCVSGQSQARIPLPALCAATQAPQQTLRRPASTPKYHGVAGALPVRPCRVAYKLAPIRFETPILA
jgi:hypothetical protein